jgi:hypothetical protein
MLGKQHGGYPCDQRSKRNVGHYIVNSGWDGKWIHAIQTEDGFCIVNPKSWTRVVELISEAELNYRSVDRRSGMPKGFEAVGRFYAVASYPTGYIDLMTAHAKYRPQVVLEKSKYDAYLKELTKADLNFKLRKETGWTINSDVLGSLFTCFFAGPGELTYEIQDGNFRVCKRPSAFTRFLTGQKTGDSLNIVPINGITEIIVAPCQIDLLLAHKRILSVGRTMSSIHSSQG